MGAATLTWLECAKFGKALPQMAATCMQRYARCVPATRPAIEDLRPEAADEFKRQLRTSEYVIDPVTRDTIFDLVAAGLQSAQAKRRPVDVTRCGKAERVTM
jgi:hypothetical protein